MFVSATAELCSDIPVNDPTTDTVAKQSQGEQTLEVSCDMLVQGEVLEETVYLCTSGVGLRKLNISVSVLYINVFMYVGQNFAETANKNE